MFALDADRLSKMFGLGMASAVLIDAVITTACSSRAIKRAGRC